MSLPLRKTNILLMKIQHVTPIVAVTALLLAGIPSVAQASETPSQVTKASALSWAVTYNANIPTNVEVTPAEKALEEQQASIATYQKTVAEVKAALERERLEKIAAEKAAKEKAEREALAKKQAEEAKKAAEVKAAADKKAAEEAAAQQAVAEAQAAEEAAQAATAAAAASQQVAAPASAGGSNISAAATPKSFDALSGTDRQKIVQLAHQYLGTPYVWGGNTPSGWDCTGMVQWVVSNATGKATPRTVTAMYASNALVQISQSTAQPGDLVVFSDASGPYHVGIYIGNGQMIHSPTPGSVTSISPVWGTPTYHALNL